MSNAKPKVLVTDPEYRKAEGSFIGAHGLECVPAPEIEQELAVAIRDSESRYVIVGNRKYSGPLYDAMPAGGVIARIFSRS